MEKENLAPQIPEGDVFEREDRCLRAIKNVGKACVMRVVVTGLLLYVLVRNHQQIWLWGLLGFVMVINLSGMLPLLAELKKRFLELREIRSSEE